MIEKTEAQKRVNRCLDALDSILCIARGTVSHFRQQNKLLSKAKKEFEQALDGLFSPDDIPPASREDPE